jgi:hypothetical protein
MPHWIIEMYAFPCRKHIQPSREMQTAQQLPLIHIVNEDDKILSQTPTADWYRILATFPWHLYRFLAAQYYDALYHFNQQQSKKQKSNIMKKDPKSSETAKEAAQRLLFKRATLDPNAPVLHQDKPLPSLPATVDPFSLAPGVVPFRIAGKKPKCFFALFKAFIGATLMGFAPEPEKVHLLLTTNLAFARVCGFVPRMAQDQYWHTHVPSLRKLEQFDQIMTERHFWSQQKWEEVRRNILSGAIQPEDELVGDTSHYHAYSSFETVKYQDEKGQAQKKSQSKVTKRCQCDDKKHCEHPWELADEGAGTIVKSATKMYWGHKASILGLPKQGIPLDAVAVADGSTHDSRTLVPHLERLFKHLPEIRSWTKKVLYDSACDDQKLKQTLRDSFHIELKASLNPRSKKPVKEGLPRGMKELTPSGELICRAGRTMEYLGMRFETESFVFGPPKNDFFDEALGLKLRA